MVALVKRSVVLALGTIVVLGGGWVIFTYPPAEHTFYPRCVFRALTGLECPGCGSTRAVHHLLHGRIGEAFLLNPFLFAVMALVLVIAVNFARGRRPEFLTRPWFGWATAVVVVGWWIVRNTPFYPY